VRLYQAVTLGARRFPTDESGALVKGAPRHPIVEDDVVIYAGATILGRITVGAGSTIGGNVWLTQSVEPGSSTIPGPTIGRACGKRSAGIAAGVDLGCWSEPDRRIWTERLDAALAMTEGPLVVVAHSLGCLTIAWWALGASHERLARIRGALLVAPPDVDATDAHPFVRRFAPAPGTALPFPSILVASRDDRYAAFDRLETLARAWGSRFVDVGQAGHINAKSGLGDWPDGEVLLEELIERNAPFRIGSPAHRPKGLAK
jgi:predicted alpha/beta hydrolase family esterase